MIEPFEYEKTRSKRDVRENVTDGKLDSSLLDRPLKRLNHFDGVSEFDRYAAASAPFTKAHQERVGRVGENESHKADQQSEAIGQLGSLDAGYDMTGAELGKERSNASQLLSQYLDRTVNFLPQMRDPEESITNLRVHEPVLQPGISFIDSRKNVATRF